ncbi:hypothetical protein [Streptomyces sp. NPDC005548]|uniref:hypothetical protein n=1 Tax=Streptomyces sp. NPDC005548 TaxID=3364724 RepID=UPI0036A08730
MNEQQESRPTPGEWKRAIEMLLEVQRTIVASVESGCVEEHDHHIVGLPSGVEGTMPGGARIEAALHAVMGARHLVQQAAFGTELPGVPILQRAQNNFALAGGYVAATWTTELSEDVEKRSK